MEVNYPKAVIKDIAGKPLMIDVWQQYKIWNHYMATTVTHDNNFYIVADCYAYKNPVTNYNNPPTEKDKVISERIYLRYLKGSGYPVIPFQEFFFTVTGNEWYMLNRKEINIA